MPGKGPNVPKVKGKGITNSQVLTKSVQDCRAAYSNLSDLTFSLWYQRKFGIKSDRVLEILGAKNSDMGGIA